MTFLQCYKHIIHIIGGHLYVVAVFMLLVSMCPMFITEFSMNLLGFLFIFPKFLCYLRILLFWSIRNDMIYIHPWTAKNRVSA